MKKDAQKLIKHLLIDADISISELERRMSLTRNTLRNSINRNSLKLQVAIEIANVLGKEIRFVDKIL